MKGYLVGNLEVTNADAYREYREKAEVIVRQYGGRYLVRGGKIDQIEGEQKVGRLVVLEFPSLAAAELFYRSDEYQKIIPLRQRNSKTHMFVLVEGYAG
jgi:uncharacterized protein (DUF1330 family)